MYEILFYHVKCFCDSYPPKIVIEIIIDWKNNTYHTHDILYKYKNSIKSLKKKKKQVLYLKVSRRQWYSQGSVITLKLLFIALFFSIGKG